ncbi:MAG: hypothetical protein HY890_01245 [Deltaproteobacteria bacterium]|nr:hypothetical protein [Deltaproteobacteria bacterium]
MSFYTVIKTELKNKKYVIAALEELKARGEISRYEEILKKNRIKVNRGGDAIEIVMDIKTGNVHVEGDARVVEDFTKRLKQLYAYASIKENLPFDFEIANERDIAGDITLVLKG